MAYFSREHLFQDSVSRVFYYEPVGPKRYHMGSLPTPTLCFGLTKGQTPTESNATTVMPY